MQFLILLIGIPSLIGIVKCSYDRRIRNEVLNEIREESRRRQLGSLRVFEENQKKIDEGFKKVNENPPKTIKEAYEKNLEILRRLE